MGDGTRLAGQVDSRLFHQAEFLKIGIKFIHAHPQRHIDKYGIAGIFHPLHKSFAAMAVPVGAVNSPVIHHPVAGTVKGILKRHCPGLQPRGGGDHLEGGARFIGVVDTDVPPHLIQPLLQLFLRKRAFIGAVVEGKGIIQIKFRHIDAGINFSVLRIHNQNRHRFRLFLFHHPQRFLLGVFLDIPVQAHGEIIAGHRFYAALPDLSDFNSPGIGGGENFPVNAF